MDWSLEMWEMIENLRGFSTPELCDGMSEPFVMDYQIKPMVTDRKIVGPAFTVKVPVGVSGIIPDALEKVVAGQVLVIAGGGFCERSYWGDHRSICARLKHIEGVVIDGAFRDIEGCKEAGVPIYAKALVPASCKKEAQGVMNVPVICGGVEVRPRDIIVGDSNGVCVVKPEDAASIMERAAYKRKAQERTIRAMKRSGVIMPRVIY